MISPHAMTQRPACRLARGGRPAAVSLSAASPSRKAGPPLRPGFWYMAPLRSKLRDKEEGRAGRMTDDARGYPAALDITAEDANRRYAGCGMFRGAPNGPRPWPIV